LCVEGKGSPQGTCKRGLDAFPALVLQEHSCFSFSHCHSSFTMSDPPKLPMEVIAQIIPYLKRSTRKATGRAAVSEKFHQKDLATMMRVSKVRTSSSVTTGSLIDALGSARIDCQTPVRRGGGKPNQWSDHGL